MQVIEIFAGVGIVRRALFLPGRPRGDFRTAARVFGVGVDPGEHSGVALRNHRFQRFGVNADKFQKPLVEWTVIMIFAVFAGDRGAALV